MNIKIIQQPYLRAMDFYFNFLQSFCNFWKTATETKAKDLKKKQRKSARKQKFHCAHLLRFEYS